LNQHRFEFGKNWQEFLATITSESIAKAELALRRLFPHDEVSNSTFLDVGCGSRLSLFAAKRLGARELHGLDFDAQSVAAAEQFLAGHNTHGHND